MSTLHEETEPGSTIPARSHRQAMDWSLVLISQGIESTVVRREGTWWIVVDPEVEGTALLALNQYVRENRRWYRGYSVEEASDLFHPGVLGWCALLVLFFIWSEAAPSDVKQPGTMDSLAVSAGAWWRLFTAVCLHADLSHLMANLTIGFLLLGFAMARWGYGYALLAAWLSGVAGNIAGWVFYAQPHRGLGASGMVMGALGLLAVTPFLEASAWRSPRRWMLRGLLGGLLLFVLLGMDPSSDVLAHLGGVIAGCLFGFGLGLLPVQRRLDPVPNFLCALSTAMLLLYTWALALS